MVSSMSQTQKLIQTQILFCFFGHRRVSLEGHRAVNIGDEALFEKCVHAKDLVAHPFLLWSKHCPIV